MVRREVFERAGGFDEALAIAFNDVDLCLKIQALGLHNVYLPHVVLVHHESKSRGDEDRRRRSKRGFRASGGSCRSAGTSGAATIRTTARI